MKIGNIRTLFMTSTVLAAGLVISGAAQAQSAPAEEETADQGGIAEIIVTARKSSENIQSVPVAVTALSADDLASKQVFEVTDLARTAPSLTISTGGTGPASIVYLAIRGQAQNSPNSLSDSSVGIYMDGVYVARPIVGNLGFLDMASAEVLRGPQGTLFGKNASAGVVSIVTKRPTAEFGATVEGSFFAKSEYRGRATVNVPLSANVRSRFTGFYGSYDGNVNNLTTGNKVNGYEHYSVRGAIEADVSEKIMLTLRADYRKANDDCCAEIIGNTPTNAAALALAGTGFDASNSRNIRQNLVTTTKEESWGIALQADIELGEHSLTSITSLRGWDNTEIRDGDWLDRPYVGLNQLHDNGPQTSTTFSQEIRVASPTGEFLEYVVGAYYSKAESDRTFTREVITCSASTLAAVVPGLVPCSTAAGVSTITTPAGTADFGSTFKNMSLFGQATLNLSDSLRFIGGLRYTNDELDVNHIRRTSLAGPGVQPNFDAGVYNNGLVATAPATGFVAGASNGVPFTTSTSNNNLSGKAAVQADLTENNMAYASYTRGYKGPAYNIFYNLTTPGAGVIAPETVNAYEVGLKNTLFDGALILNLAAYYAKYNNYQANSPDFVAGVRTTRLTNAGSVSTQGFEVDFVATPLRNFSLSGGVAYNKAQVENFRLPPGADASQLVAKGTPLANAPKWKMSFGAQYDIETSGFANIELASQISRQSDQIYEASANPAVRLGSTVDGYAIVDVSAALVDPNDGWRVALQVKNLFDKSFASSIVSGGPGGAYRYIIPREADRYVGVTAKINFGAK